MANPGDLSSNKIKNSFQRLVQYERADFEMYDGTGSRVNDLNIPNSITSSNMSLGNLEVTNLTASYVRISHELSNSGSTWLGDSVCDDKHQFTGHTWITGSLTVSHSCTFRNIGQAKFIYLDNPVIEDQKPAVVNRGTGTGQYNVPRFGGQDAALDVYGNAVITGSLIVLDTIWAQEFHSEVVSQSIIYTSGSSKFGAESDDTMTVTGSIFQSGSDSYFLNGIGIGTTGSNKAGTYLEPGQDNPVLMSHLLTIADPGHNYGDGDAGVQGYKLGRIAHWSYLNLANDAVRIYDKHRGEDVLNVNSVYANIFLGSATGSVADQSSTEGVGKGGQYRVAINAPSASALPSDSNLFVSSSAHARTRIESSGSDASASLVLRSGLSHWEMSTMSGSGSVSTTPRRATHTESLSIRAYTSPHSYARKELIKVSNTGDVGLGINVFDNQVGGTEPSARLHVSHSDSTLVRLESSHDQVALELKTNSGTGKPGYSSKYIAMKDDKLIFGHHVSKSSGAEGLQLNDPNHSFIISGSKGHVGVRMNPASGSGTAVVGNAFKHEFTISGSMNIIRGRYSSSSWKLDADGKMHSIAFHLADGTNGLYFNNEKTLFLSGSGTHTNYIFGQESGQNLTTGYSNIFVGHRSGEQITTGNRNVIVGNLSFDEATTGGLNTAVGYGNFANSELSSEGNTAIGSNAQSQLRTGDYNVSVGYDVLQRNRDGQDNIAIGRNAGRQNVSGSYNIFLGPRAGYGTSSIGNALDSQASYNTAIGYYAQPAYKDRYGAVVNNAVAIGKNAVVSQSDSMVFGPAHHSSLTNGGHRPRYRIGMGGITAPNATLEVSGTVNFTGSLMISGSTGTAKYNKKSGSLKVSGSGVFVQTRLDAQRFTGHGWTERASADPKSRGGALSVYGKSFHYGTMRISGSNNEENEKYGIVSNPSMSALMVSGGQYNHGDIDVTGSIYVHNSGSFENAMIEKVLTIGQKPHYDPTPEVNHEANIALDVFKPEGGEFAASFNGVVSMSHNLIFNNSASIMVHDSAHAEKIFFRKDTNNANRFYNENAPFYFFTGSTANGITDELINQVPAVTISGSNSRISTYGSAEDQNKDYYAGVRVGIGTISASKALTIKGSISASGDLFVDKFFVGSSSRHASYDSNIAVFSASMISGSNYKIGYNNEADDNEATWMMMDPVHDRTHQWDPSKDQNYAGIGSVHIGPWQTGLVARYATTLGYKAGMALSGSGNTVIGSQAATALEAGEALNNTIVGYFAAGTMRSGSNNVIVGANAAQQLGRLIKASGSQSNPKHNVIVGDAASHLNRSGSQNVIIGALAGGQTGSHAYTAVQTLETSLSGSIFIGTHAGGNMVGKGMRNDPHRIPFGNIGIGHRISMASPSASHQMNIGNMIWATGSGDIQYLGLGHHTRMHPTKTLQVKGDISASNALFIGHGDPSVKDHAGSGVGMEFISASAGNISMSGWISASALEIYGSSVAITRGHYTSSGNIWAQGYVSASTISSSGQLLGGSIYSVGQISSSGAIYGTNYWVGDRKFANPSISDEKGIELGNSGDGNLLLNHVTASGNITGSATSNISAGTGSFTTLTGNNSSSIILTQNGNKGTNIAITSGSALEDPFHATAPPMVSGLQPHIKVMTIDPSNLHGVVDGIQGKNIGGNTSIWEHDTDNSAALGTAISATLPYGSFNLTTGTADGNQTAIATTLKPVSCAPADLSAGAQWWAKIKFNISDVDGMEFFWGLSERAFDTAAFHLTAAGTGTDRLGFVKKAHGNTKVELAATFNSAGTIATDFATAQTLDVDNQAVEYAMHWDGINKVSFYAAKADTNTLGVTTPMQLIHEYTGDGISTDMPCYFGLMVYNGLGSAAKTANVEYMSLATVQGAALIYP